MVIQIFAIYMTRTKYKYYFVFTSHNLGIVLVAAVCSTPVQFINKLTALQFLSYSKCLS